MGMRLARSVAVAGPSAASAARIARRVGSARAVKTSSATDSMSGRDGIEVLDQLPELVTPTLGVAVECLAVAVVTQLREARFDDGQPGASVGRLEGELDVRAARIVIGQAVDAPRVAEDGRLLDPLDAHRG